MKSNEQEHQKEALRGLTALDVAAVSSTGRSSDE